MKNINKTIIACIGVICLAIPAHAQAALINYDKDNITNDKGEVRVPLTLTINEGESLSNISLSCDISDVEMKCDFDSLKYTDAISKSGVFTPTSGKTFPVGTTKIGDLVINNPNASAKAITFTVLSSTNGVNTDAIKNKDITIKAKEEIREKSHDATLKTLKPSQGTMNPEFNPNTYEYTVYNIADTINSLNLNWECNANQCDAQIAGISGRKVSLKQGDNRIEVIVESEAGDEEDTKTYVLNIIRGDTGYNSAKLSSLSFEGYELTPTFKNDITEYSISVPNNFTSLINILKFEKEDTKAKETLNGFDNLIVGENKATITIDNVNGDESITYTINITRMNDTNIQVLKYKDGEITFSDSNGVKSTLNEDDFKKLYVDEWEKINDGTYKFDEDGNIKKDKEEPELKKDEQKNNVWVIVAIIAVGLIIIIISGIFIFKKKKPEELKETNEENTSDTVISTDEKKKKGKKENKTADENEIDQEIDETNIEEELVKNENKQKINDTMEIDEALVDLMSTKKYNFKDEE